MSTKLVENLPLALMGSAFLSLALATQCAENEPVATSANTAQPTATACNNDLDCPLPASRCGSPNELDYYSDPKCLNGLCSWHTATNACPCYSGGCQGTTTASSSVMMPSGDNGGQPGQVNVDVEAGEAPNEPGDATIDHATVAAPDAGGCTLGDDAAACSVPPSVCADDHWLAFFTNGSCQQNRCQWQVDYRYCDAGCEAGSCIMNFTIR